MCGPGDCDLLMCVGGFVAARGHKGQAISHPQISARCRWRNLNIELPNGRDLRLIYVFPVCTSHDPMS